MARIKNRLLAAKIDTDEALRLGLRRYRDLHAEGTISADIEDRLTFNVRPDRLKHTVQLCIWGAEEANPHIVFETIIDRETGSILVSKDVVDQYQG